MAADGRVELNGWGAWACLTCTAGSGRRTAVQWASSAVALAAVSGIYFGTGKLCQGVLLSDPIISPVWLPTGIAFATMILAGWWIWPAIFVGEFLVAATSEIAPLPALGMAMGNTLESLLATYLVNRLAEGRAVFDHARGIFLFTGLAAVLSTMVSATVGVGSLFFSGESGVLHWARPWLVWWLGNATGALLITPPLVLWARDRSTRWRRRRLVEGGLAMGLLLLAGAVAFYGLFAPAVTNQPIAFVCTPILLWIAFRFGVRGAATGNLVLMTVAMGGTVRGFGPFVGEDVGNSLLLLQTYLAVASVTMLSFAAVVGQLRGANETIIRLNADLEQRVRDRTSQLEAANWEIEREMQLLAEAHERLLQAERLSAIGEAMAGLAHESRNALQRCQSSLEMLERRVRDVPQVSDLVHRIQQTQEELYHLYEEVREYAAPLVIQPAPCDLDVVLRKAWEQSAEGQAARLTDVRNGMDLVCEADAFAIRQVFRNVIENSLAACPTPVEVAVGYSPAALDGREAVRVELSDNGPGLDAEQQQRMFEAFYTTKMHGTGLGMAIAKRIVEVHGGTIMADSPPGRGTRIVLTLPRRQS